MRRSTIIKELARKFGYVPEVGERHVLAHWFAEEDDKGNAVGPMIDLSKYMTLRGILPDHIWENLERARLERAGIGPMLRAGLGYEETLGSIIVDGTAIASSSAEARLIPAYMIPANYLQPGGVPGRTLRWRARGRATTLTTAATLTFRHRDGATDAFTTALAASGAITMDVTAQTNTMWMAEGETIVRAVGSAGSVFAMAHSRLAADALSLANEQANLWGSAGSTAPAAVTLDLTANRFWNWTAQWSLATAYSIQCHVFILESLN